tara:strand:+ start:3621 stop:5252 length:1632 start_codon:yes stop_codon:yes gene_type:complete
MSSEIWPSAEESALWAAVQSWRKDSMGWLELAQPRLTESLRINPLRYDCDWTNKILRELGGKTIPWLPEGGGGQGWEMPWKRGKCEDKLAELLIRALHDSGRITRQEAVSMIPVKLLDCQPGHRVLDMCAAPGSKATQLCEAINDEGIVIANESNPGRANLLVSNSKRVGVTSMVIVRHDGRHLPRCPNPGFDRILVDAPCTGSGTTRKNPEIWQNWTQKAGYNLQKLQISLVKKAAMLLAPGGRMVYSTCSLDPVENELVVAEILRICEFLILEDTDISTKCPNLISRPGMDNWVKENNEFSYDNEIINSLHLCKRIWNDENDTGGFFVAAFKHIGDSNVAKSLLSNEEMKDKHIKTPPPTNSNHQVVASDEMLKFIQKDWGVEYNKMYSRGSKLYTTSHEIEWLWAGERMLRRGGKLPGGHWHPFQVVQAGLPTWELRKGILQRPTSKGIFITAPKCTKHVHEISSSLLTNILLKGGSNIEEVAETIPGIKSERKGGVILHLTLDGHEWWLPAWLGNKLTLMIPDSERFLLSHDLGLEVIE